jgi:DNA-binding transcriptional ArsR family regulator
MSNSHHLPIDIQKIDESTSLLVAMNHPLRIQILELISKNQSMSVNAIYHSLGLDQSITSQHLRVLRDHNLVVKMKQGKYMLYSINDPFVQKAKLAIHSFVGEHKD